MSSEEEIALWRDRQEEAMRWLAKHGQTGQSAWLQAEVDRCRQRFEKLQAAVARGKLALSEQIARSQHVRKWLVSSGANLEARQTARVVAVAASMQVALEHHGAIIVLAKQRQMASLLALLRPMYEAYVWSAWLFRVATGDQLVDLAHNRLGRGLERMIGDLDRLQVFDRPMLRDMKPVIDRMNGFVHGGYHHLRYRIHKDRTEPRYPDDLVVDSLRFADLFAVMTLLEWPAMTEDVPMGDSLYAEARFLLGLERQ